MDVPATISDLLQQFFVEFVKVPQLQFIDIVVGFVVRRDRYTVQTVQKTVVIRTGAVLGPVGIPVVVQRQVLRFTEQKTVEVPQLQCSDRVVDVPAAVHRQGWTFP